MNTDSHRPRVVLGMPSYGQVFYTSALAHLTHWSADARVTEIVRRPYTNSSFLPGSFNELWKDALDLRDAGQADYFAMIHSDIEPDAWWIDTLLAELRRHNADAISAVVAIKGHERGRTSTAIGVEGDPWRLKRHLTLGALRKLPPTFGPDRACKPGEVLLINTGLFLCDLRRPWWTLADGSDYAFDTRCRIARDRAGRRVVQWRTEDWELSHHLHASGARYLATTRVGVKHWGVDYWDNHVERPRPFRLWTEIEGWLTQAEGNQLRSLARDRLVLELGSYLGRSTVCMAQVGEVTSIDLHRGDADTGRRSTLARFRRNLVDHGVADRVRVIVGRIEEEAPKLPRHAYDLVFVDGQHDEASVSRDTAIALERVKPGGAIAWHDSHYPSVQAAQRTHGFADLPAVDSLSWAILPES